ncbi:MAG: GNAT family N-acetyltransferase, partial [Bacteroidota bacterium]
KNYKIDISYLSHITETSQLYKADNSVSYAFNVCYLYDIKKFEDYAQYQETYSSGHKQNIRTSRNRMANDNLIYEEVSAPLEEKDLEKIIDISRSKLKDNKICFYDDAAKYAMAMDLYRSFDAQLISIKLNGKMVAYRTNLLYHNEKFCLDASFDRDYRRYSVGMLSVEFNLKESFKNGYHSHSEGWGKDEYKERFSTGYNTLYTKLIKGNTLLSSFWFKQYQKSLAHANAQLKSN